MSHGSPQGGYKLILVPEDRIDPYNAGDPAKAWVTTETEAGDNPRCIGPFEVIGSVSADRVLAMLREEIVTRAIPAETV